MSQIVSALLQQERRPPLLLGCGSAGRSYRLRSLHWRDQGLLRLEHCVLIDP